MNKMRGIKTKITSNDIFVNFFLMLILLSVFQQFPIIRENYYYQIRSIIYLCFAVFSSLALIKSKKIFKNTLIFKIFICIIYSIILSVFIRNQNSNFDLMELIIPFGIVICSASINISETSLFKFTMIFNLMVAILGLQLIFFYGNGFEILSTYSVPGKNAIGPLLGISAIISYIITLKYRHSTHSNIFILYNLLIFLILLFTIVVLRNRTTIISIIVIVFLSIARYFNFRITNKRVIFIYLFICSIVFLAITGILQELTLNLYKSLTLNFDVFDLNQFSSNRLSVYYDSMCFISNNFMFGELSGSIFGTEIPHNYVLNKVVQLGVLGSFPLLITYFDLWIISVKNILDDSTNKLINLILPWVLLSSLIVSLFEYTYPYGPGISQLFLWFLMGQFISINRSKRHLEVY